ncbi:MAG: HAMP domain-containing protein [Anaerolineae bacterium]|nr:HAMP domain-containing protein [Anaerolineae bacterium]
MTNWLIIAALGAGLMAVVASAILSRQLTRPLYALTHAARGLTANRLGRQVEVKGTAEMRELAEAFNQMSRSLAESEALRQRMTADIAHELRTPVSVLRGHIEAILDGVFPADTEHLAVAYDQVIHLARLIEDLRLLTQAEAGSLPLELVEIAPDDLVAQAVERFAPLAIDAEIALTQEIASGLPAVYVDVDRIQQVLGNLLSNALRHTPGGPEGRVILRVAQHDHMVRFAVLNTGQGLRPEQARHVFERFWRAEDARERDSGGSGLGLAITKQLVALHGGQIWVESGPGQTAFTFTLPAANGAAPA